MGIILDNYQAIVKNIVQSINDGTIVSANSTMIDNYSTKELFRKFTEEFNLVLHKDRIITSTIVDEILGIPIPNKAIHISSINFLNIGEVDINYDLALNTSVENVLYFDLNNLNIPRDLLNNPVITIDYVTFNNTSYEGVAL